MSQRRRRIPAPLAAAALAIALASLLPRAAHGVETVGSLIDRVNGGGAGSVEWQRIRLEDRLQERIHQAVAPSVPKDQFVVSVKVELKLYTRVADLVEKARKDRQASLGRKKNANKVARVSGEDDRIVLSKLDLDAPDFEGTGIIEEDGEIITEPDLFALISRVMISVLFDDSMPEAKKELIQKIVGSAVGRIGDITPEVTVDRVALIPPEKERKPDPLPLERPDKPWDLKRWLVEFKTALGLFGAAVVLSGLFLLAVVFVFLGYRRLEGRKIALMEARNSREEAAQADGSARESAGPAAADAQAGGADGKIVIAGQVQGQAPVEVSGPGFDKFKVLLKTSPDRAAALIKQWTKAPGKGSSDALALIPASLQAEDLVLLFRYLSVEDRRAWKKALSSQARPPNAAASEAFISAQIVDSLLVTPPPMDEQLRAQIADLTVEEAVQLASADPRIGAMLTTLLPTAQVSRMYAALPADVANSITQATLRLSEEEIRRGYGALGSSIARVKGGKARIPFLEKAFELLADIEPDKEPAIFDAIAQCQDFQLLDAAARLYFPSELVLRLPERALKACLERMPLGKRAELIGVLDQEVQTVLLDALGKPGSKAREFIDIEIEELFREEGKKRRLEKNREAILKDFTDVVRSTIRSSEVVADLADEVLDNWLAEKSGGRIGGASDSRRAA